MTISTTTNKVSYIGNGIATSFAIPFPFLEKDHLTVYQLLNDIQTQREDWTVQNGNLTFETAPANEAQIVIIREVPYTQETDYCENEILSAETLERNFDSLTMQVQQLKERIDRSVMVDLFDDTAATDLLPSIRTAVSNAANYAQTAEEKLSLATEQAKNAQQSAQTANAQALIATNKAQEAENVLINKADIDLSNCTRPYITETYHNENEWYRVWSDGWIEQGGKTNYVNSNQRIINLLKPFSSENYVILSSALGAANASAVSLKIIEQHQTYFRCVVVDGQGFQSASYWEAKGY